MIVPTWMYGAAIEADAKVAWYMQLFNFARIRRVNFEWQWEESAALCWPEWRNSFTFGHVRAPGIKYTQMQLDSNAAISSHRFAAIMDNIATPSQMVWSNYRPAGKNAKQLWKSRRVREWFHDLSDCVWYHRYRSDANFAGQNFLNWQCLGVFGNMGMFIENLDTSLGQKPGLSYRGGLTGEIYVLQNEQGLVDGYIRHFRRTARQAMQLCKAKGLEFPEVLRPALELGSQELHDFLHVVHPNTDYAPEQIFSSKGKKWKSVYISVTGYQIIGEGGFYSFPLAYDRYCQAPEEEYGRGPAQMVLPALKTLNAEKRMFLKQGNLAGDPAYLLPDDGTFDFKTHSGAFNYGGMSADGKPLVGMLPTGQIQVTEEMMKQEVGYIQSAFLVDLYQLTWDQRDTQKSAREIIEMATEKATFLAPGAGRTSTEYLAPMCYREIDVLGRAGLLPPVPPELKEAKGEYEVQFCNPLSRAMQGQEVAGFMQMVEMATNIANAGHPEVWDGIAPAFKRSFPAIAERRMVPVRWLATDEEAAAAGKSRADAQERENQVKELPGKAAIMKAQTIQSQANAGQMPGGVLSGTPPGGMPQVPGNPPGLPGQPSPAPGQPGLPGRPAP